MSQTQETKMPPRRKKPKTNIAKTGEERLALIRERNDVYRTLSPIKFKKFMLKWKLPIPPDLNIEKSLAIMHKTRLHLSGFTQDEKDASREWLTIHGYLRLGVHRDT